MTRVTAPYNFVPLSKTIVLAGEVSDDLTALPSQDVPQAVAGDEDGPLSGQIDLHLICPANTPFLVGGKDETGGRRFMRTPGGEECPVIPGSSLRGMVRNVLEIASFSRMGPVEDQRTSVRDLNNTAIVDYRNKFTGGANGPGFYPKSKAGWLRRDKSGLLIEPCDFARIEHHDIDAFVTGGGFSATLAVVAGQPSADDRLAKVIYEKFAATGTALEQEFLVEAKAHAHQHHNTKLKYHKANATGNDLNDPCVLQRGTFVFTGLPSMSKHLEFVFLDPDGDLPPLPVDPKVWKKFIDVHERQEKPSPTWEWRRRALDSGDRIPVFYLEAAGTITDIGLAMMFKLGADHTVHKMIGHTNPAHLDLNSDDLDLATRIFGRAPGPRDGHEGFRTRVSFGWASLDNPADKTEQVHSVALAKPKPGFVPSYVRQRDFNSMGEAKLLNYEEDTRNGPRPVRAQYRSYMKWDNGGDEIRGWKRYPARNDPTTPNGEPAPTGSTTLSTLHPIVGTADLRFDGAIRYHNLHPVELGTLLWALTFGSLENQNHRHALGSGKALGWGQVYFELCENSTHRARFGEFINTFENAMNEHTAFRDRPEKWRGSMQVRSLLAMARPGTANSLLDQMVLDPDSEKNDFRDAKNDGYFLPEYLPPTEWPQHFADKVLSEPNRVKSPGPAARTAELINLKRRAMAVYRARVAQTARPRPLSTATPDPTTRPTPATTPPPAPPTDENLFKPGMRVEITGKPGEVYEITDVPSRLAGARYVDLKSVLNGDMVIPVRTDQIRSLGPE